MSIDEFFNLLSQDTRKWFINRRGQLRTLGQRGVEVCPIIAVAAKLGRNPENFTVCWPDVYKNIGLPKEVASDIADAADGEHPLRPQLERACRLTSS